jgi:predicted transcriptional regulator
VPPDATEPTPRPDFQPEFQPDSEARDGGYDAPAAAFVERFAADMTEGGVQRMASRVFACLLASDDGALSSAQLAERLRVSPAAISGAVRYLSQVHMVSRERDPGSRRELYRVHENVWFEALLDRDQLLTRWRSTLRTGVEALGPASRAGRRIQETHDFLEFLQGELSGMLDRWYALRRAQAGEAADEAAGSGKDGVTREA